jgi:lipopolysaccharide transport system ATP-binding protein
MTNLPRTPALQPAVAQNEPALRVAALGKAYRLWANPRARLEVPVLLRLASGLSRLGFLGAAERLQKRADALGPSHQALQGVSFVLQRGEALGIIGANGSGKSTLLQMVAGVLQPTEGEVQVNGRVAALLELGSGFNPELTGRENIAINAAILGLTDAQIAERLPAIEAFADIGPYIDQPIKSYSSGMVVRLAFAVQVHIEPDVLIVDEALAVGDAAFQAKAMAKVDEILRRGTTLLFVGHDLNVVKAFCHRAMLLEHGRVAMEGLPDEVITEYLYRTHQKALAAKGASGAATLQRTEDGFATARMAVEAASINGAQHVALRCGERAEVRLAVRVDPDVANPLLIFDLMDARGLQLSGRRIRLPHARDGAPVNVFIGFDAQLQQGVYRCRLRLLDSADVHQHVVLARHEGVPSFEVVDDSRERFTGLFPLPMQVDVAAQGEN